MTRTEDRLADALGAAARSVREDTLSPLVVPSRQRRTRHALVAPIAAAAALLLAVGVGAAVSGHFPGTGHIAPGTTAVGPPPRYYVDGEYDSTGHKTVVRATATGAVTATVPVTVPLTGGTFLNALNELTASADGEFFVFGSLAGSKPNQSTLYQFRLTAAGQVTGLSPVPGGVFGSVGYPESIAASPDGSEFAIALDSPSYCCDSSPEIVVINTATGERTVWQGGMSRPGLGYEVSSLSWTSNGELAFLVQWFKGSSADPAGEADEMGSGELADSQVWAVDPGSAGGRLNSGQMLLSQSAQFPAFTQAMISPDGSTLTAVVVNQEPIIWQPNTAEAVMEKRGRFSVDQISVATGARLKTLYQAHVRDSEEVYLSSDGADHWLITGNPNTNAGFPGFNGWLENGRLIPLPPSPPTSLDQVAWSSGEPSAPVRSHTPARVGQPPITLGEAPHYYVETDSDGQVVVRSTPTGSVTDTVGIPRSPGALVTAAGNGTFFVAARAPGSAGPRLYEFRLTGTGQVTGLSELPGGPIGTGAADAIAAAPDGSQVAVAIGPAGSFCSGVPCTSPENGKGADYIAVINVATGTRSLWRGGMPNSLYIPSLSWTANGRELVFLGQTCQAGPARSQILTGCVSLPSPTTSPTGQPSITGQSSLTRQSSEVWALDPVSGGGRLSSAHPLLRQSAAYQDVAQAVINPDGSTITAVLVTGPTSDETPAVAQAVVSVAQISVTTGKQVGVLYREVVGQAPGTDQTVAPFVSPNPAPLLTSDGTGRYWLLAVPYPAGSNGTERNGWIRAGQLATLPPSGASVASEAW